MSKAFMAEAIQKSVEITGVAPYEAIEDFIGMIVSELRQNCGLMFLSLGTLAVPKIRAYNGANPRTGEPIEVKAGKTVRFKASPSLKRVV